MQNLPNHLMYTKTHEWVNTSQEEMTVGITEHAQSLLGDMVFVELPEVGQEIEKGAELGVVESVKAASDVYAPISGIVIAVNQALSQKPELINEDPYGQGWLIKLKPNNQNEMQDLLSAEQYQLEASKDH